MGKTTTNEPWFEEADAQGARDFFAAYEDRFDEIFRDMLEEWNAVIRPAPGAALSPTAIAEWRARSRYALERAIAGDWPDYEEHVRARARHYAASRIPFATWFGFIRAVKETLTPVFLARFGTDGARLRGALRAMRRFVDRTLVLLGEEYIHANEGQRTAIFDASVHAIITTDGDCRILEFNAAAERMFGHPAAHAIGARSVDLLIPEAARTVHRERVKKVLAVVTPERPGERLEIVACRADGTEFPAELLFAQIATRGPLLYTAFVRDLTAEKRASAELERQKDEAEAAARRLACSEERLRALAARLDAAREEESRRIARDVHDVLGQSLTALKLDLTWLGCRLARELRLEDVREIGTERCRAMIELVDGTLDAVKRIAADLRPGVLDELGIEAALEWQTNEFGRRSGIAVHLYLPATPIVLGAAEATALFRISQEALTNVARHAQATRVTVRLAAAEGDALLVISDDGIGLRDDRSTSRAALGLVGMRERAVLLGGSVAVSGAPGNGTTVVARVPLSGVSSR